MDGWGVYCTFYYQGQSARTSTAYIIITSTPPAPPPTPVYGSMSGLAYEGGGGYAIYLQNGEQVYVDAWKCKVEGRFYDGCSAVVYYTDYPSSENIYRVDIYGNQGLIIDDPYATGLLPEDTYATGLLTDAGTDADLFSGQG